jgi:hypothetical protein
MCLTAPLIPRQHRHTFVEYLTNSEIFILKKQNISEDFLISLKKFSLKSIIFEN